MDWAAATQVLLGTCRDTFGEAVTYLPAAGGSAAIRGIYDAAFRAVDPQTGIPLSSTHPVLGVRLSDLAAAPAKGDRATIRGTTFNVIEAQPDGQGWALLILHK